MIVRRVQPLTRELLAELPTECRGCAYWELDPVAERLARSTGQTEAAKASWLSATTQTWGPCGLAVRMDGVVAGFVLYAPAGLVPRADAFATSPVSPDAVLLTGLWVAPQQRMTGLGRLLVQSVAKQLVQRDVVALETFGASGTARGECLLPVGFLESVGFGSVRAHARHPRLRLDLRATARWRDDVDGALERLLGVLPVRRGPAPGVVSARGLVGGVPRPGPTA